MNKLSNAQLWVNDQDEAVAFYTEKLGWRVREDITLPELGVAEKTVKTHVSHILGKLDLTDRTQAALYAVRHGLV